MRIFVLLVSFFLCSCSSLHYSNLEPTGEYIGSDVNMSSHLTLNADNTYSYETHWTSCESAHDSGIDKGYGTWELLNGVIKFNETEGSGFHYLSDLILAKYGRKEILVKANQLERYSKDSSSLWAEFIKK